MTTRFDTCEDEVDGFPFPYQLTPPQSKNISPIYSDDDMFYTSEQKTVIVRGGFGTTEEPSLAINGMRCYPPLPNSAYGLTSQAYIPPDVDVSFKVYTPESTEDGSGGHANETDMDDSDSVLEMPSIRRKRNIDSGIVKALDGSAPDRDEASTRVPQEDPEKKQRTINDLVGHNPPRRHPLTLTIHTRTKETSEGDQAPKASSNKTRTRGELLADKIDFDRTSWVMTTPGISGNLYDGKEQRADYIKYVDSIDEENWSLHGLDYCKVCKKKHIPPGPPITLEDRDTCGAYLPEWFPIDEFETPWYSYNKMMNEMVRLEEILQGYGHKPNPDQPFWDLQFHEYSSKWKIIGKRGGWWKCRAGEDATDVERNCHVCHNEKVDVEHAAHITRKGDSISQRLDTIKIFIETRMKAVGERDKELALAQIRAEGYSEYIGPRTVEDEKFRNPVLARTATMSTIRSHFSADGDATPHGWGSPQQRLSPERGRSPP